MAGNSWNMASQYQNSPTPKKSGQVKMAVEGPAHGTNMGSMQARNTSSSVNGATTWFLSQRMSLKQDSQKHGSAVGRSRQEEVIVATVDEAECSHPLMGWSVGVSR